MRIHEEMRVVLAWAYAAEALHSSHVASRKVILIEGAIVVGRIARR